MLVPAVDHELQRLYALERLTADGKFELAASLLDAADAQRERPSRCCINALP